MNDEQKTDYYRAAGELFGLLRDSLGFGELVMFTRQWGEYAGPPTIVYQWTFKAGRDDYCVDESITPELVLIEKDELPHLAERMCSRWKNRHRKITDPATN